MLTIVGRGGWSHTWQINETLLLDDFKLLDVEMIEVDGNELGFIRAQFKNLPDTPQQSGVTWVGSMARFIAVNLRTELGGNS